MKIVNVIIVLASMSAVGLNLAMNHGAPLRIVVTPPSKVAHQILPNNSNLSTIQEDEHVQSLAVPTRHSVIQRHAVTPMASDDQYAVAPNVVYYITINQPAEPTCCTIS